jgi:hypothetical protein
MAAARANRNEVVTQAARRRMIRNDLLLQVNCGTDLILFGRDSNPKPAPHNKGVAAVAFS